MQGPRSIKKTELRKKEARLVEEEKDGFMLPWIGYTFCVTIFQENNLEIAHHNGFRSEKHPAENASVIFFHGGTGIRRIGREAAQHIWVQKAHRTRKKVQAC